MDRKGIIISIVLGILVAVASGFIPTSLESEATLHGFPFTWRVQVMSEPEGNPWIYDYFMLLVDMILCGMLVSVGVEFYMNLPK